MGAVGITPDCIDSGKGEDPSPLLFKHPGNQQTAELKRGSKIDFKNPVPLLIRYFKQVLMGTGRSIVDQNINPSKSLKRFFRDAFHFGPIRDVPNRDMSLGSQGFCFTCGLLTGIKVAASMDHQVHSIFGESQGDSASDVFPGTGDEGGTFRCHDFSFSLLKMHH